MEEKNTQKKKIPSFLIIAIVFIVVLIAAKLFVWLFYKPIESLIEAPSTAYTYDLTSNNKYYYNQLTDIEKELYDRIIEAVQIGKAIVDIKDLGLYHSTTDVVANVNRALIYDICWAPQFSDFDWVNATFDKSDDKILAFVINYKSIEIKSQIKFGIEVGKIIEQAENQSTDYDKLLSIHNWLVDNTKYEKHTDTYSDPMYADGPIVKNIGDCGGYARAFQYLAQTMGFECIFVSGFVNSTDVPDHAWNMVKLDSKWYNVDVTLDDSYNTDDYFLAGSDSFNKYHRVDEAFVYPEAVQFDYIPIITISSDIITQETGD